MFNFECWSLGGHHTKVWMVGIIRGFNVLLYAPMSVWKPRVTIFVFKNLIFMFYI